MVLLAVAAGCTRSFFRNRADRDVEALLAEKSIDPRWAVDQSWYVYPDQRARFADFDKPDKPRKPPDDPQAAALSPDSQPFRTWFHSGPDQGGQGYLEFLRYCDQYNRAILAQANANDGKPMASLGNPAQPTGYGAPDASGRGTPESFEKALRIDERGFLISLDQAVELSQFNARDLQDRREDLYLAALPVTQQRFNFYTQLFAGSQAIREWRGHQVPGGPASLWNINSTGSASQLFPTGAQLVARLANQMVIDLSHGNMTTSFSNLTLQLTQPLLQGGGWAVTMEPLTQTERTLVYAVRSFARFRANFYGFIAVGTDPFNSVFSYPGLALRGVTPSPNSPNQGFLPTLLAAAIVRNDRENLVTLAEYLALYKEFAGRGDVSELQVGQVEQQILNSEATTMRDRQNLLTGLDRLKIQLGLPTQLPIELDDGPTQPIHKVLSEFTRARDDFNAIREEAERFRDQFRAPLQAVAGSIVGPIPVGVPLRDKVEHLLLNSAMGRSTKQFRASITGRWDRWRRMTAEELQAEIRRLAEKVRELEVRQARAEAVNQRLSAEDEALLDSLPKDLAIGQLEQSVRRYESARAKKEVMARDTAVLYEESVNNLVRVMNEARTERREIIRASWPTLPPVPVDGADMLKDDLDKAQTVASQVALANRTELMTARAEMVDAWRQIAVRANSLLGVLNVGYNLSTTSPPNANEPFALGGSRSTHQLVIDGELPLVRRAERNLYRTALIQYQRSRRTLQATEDFILSDVRNDLRNLRVQAENYRIQRRAVEVAYDLVESSLDVFQAPAQPAGGPAQPGQAAAQANAGNAAALTQQLLSAQTSLVSAQNALYTAWVNYLVARTTFFRDIERLRLDPRGVWIDEYSSPPTVEPESLPSPSPVGDPIAGDFAELRTAGDR